MYRTLDDIDVKGQRVLLRVDLNVPMAGSMVSDSTRLTKAAPTILELMKRGARVIILSHFGRPNGVVKESMSLKPISDVLGSIIGRQVSFSSSSIGSAAETAVNSLASGEVLVLENLRFHAEEENNDPDFARTLAQLGDIYVNDAFSVSHRSHASTEQLAHLLPSAVGRQLDLELSTLSIALEKPKRPVMAVVGGAKVSTKLDVLLNLIEKVDSLVIGGAMANTFLFAKGFEIGASLHEPNLLSTAQNIMEKADRIKCNIMLPTDVVTSSKLELGAKSKVYKVESVPHKKMILDLGPETVFNIKKSLFECKTILWNGPLGAFEIPPFDEGTVTLAKEVGKLTIDGQLVSVAGGGDTIAALNKAKVLNAFSHVSTGGGAFLEWLEGKSLPGISALS